MLRVSLAGVDITDLVLGDPTQIRYATDYPYFSDTEISDISFIVFSEDSDFDPLNPNNWFSRYWDRDVGSGFNWNLTGYKCPMKVYSTDEVVVFDGFITEIIPAISQATATLKATDKSFDLRETELDTHDFGQRRFLGLGEPDRQNVYQMPSTSAPVYPESFTAQYMHGGGTNPLNRVVSLKSEGIAPINDYIVHPDAPAIQTGGELPEKTAIAVGFREPHRWSRLAAIVKKIVSNVNADIKTEIDVPTWRTPAPEFATRGRVGWHIEGGRGINSPPQWSWTGFVRDFVVDPETGDTFFLYGERGGFSSIVYYNYETDTYTQHTCSLRFAGQLQSLWRLASADYREFYILAVSSPVPQDRTGFETGHNYNSVSTQATAAQKPKILKWTFADRNNAAAGWSQTLFDDSPQLANYIYTNDDTGGGVRNWWADTRRTFTAFRFENRNYLAYITQSANNAGGLTIRNLTDGTVVATSRSVGPTLSGLGGEFAVEVSLSLARSYLIHIGESGDLKLYQTAQLGGTYNLVKTLADTPYLSASDMLIHSASGSSTLYCVLQFERGGGRFPGARLVRFRSNNSWNLEIIKEYDYYILSARGGVVHDEKVYYYEGGLDVYGNPSGLSARDRYERGTGHLVEVSSGAVKNCGSVWRSAYSGEIEHYDYGAHTAMVAPMRSDGERLHLIAGYGNPFLFTTPLENDTDFLDDPQEDINNWQWITYGQDQELYLERLVVTHEESAWDLLKSLAELSYSKIGYSGDTFFFKSRRILAGYDTSPVDNYSVNETLLSIGVHPTYTQLFNQIRGNITYTLKDAIPNTVDERELFALDEASVEFFGELPFPIEMSRLTHHQSWWALLLADHYLKELSRLRYDIEMTLEWSPHLKIGDIVSVDVKHPVFSDSEYRWDTTVLDEIDAQIISVTHVVAADETHTAWTTQVVARTFDVYTPAADDTTPALIEPPTQTYPAPSFGELMLDDKIYTIGCEIATLQLPIASDGTPVLTYSVSGLPAGFSVDALTRQIHGIPTALTTLKPITYTVTDLEGRTATLTFNITVEAKPTWGGVAIVPGRAYVLEPTLKRGRSFNIITGGRLTAQDLIVQGGDIQDITSNASALIVLDNRSKIARFWDHDIQRLSASDVRLGTGDFVGIAASATRVYVLDKTLAVVKVWNFRSNTHIASENVDLKLVADYRCIAIVGNILYCLIDNLPVLLAWDLTSKERIPEKDMPLIPNSTGWVGIDYFQDTDTLYAVRSVGTRLVAYTVSSRMRTVASDVRLGGA